ncbi:hypothetical protein ALMP_27750 [Streptomyces sp. A012304]|nr:hypothetical protein ALMP_27750 [Streptomyces sp. A012304]
MVNMPGAELEGGGGVRVERSGTRHCGGAGTPSGRQSVTFVAKDVARNPRPYTVPHVMHLPLLPASAPALARVPTIRACANWHAFRIPLAEFNSRACAGI